MNLNDLPKLTQTQLAAIAGRVNGGGRLIHVAVRMANRGWDKARNVGCFCVIENPSVVHPGMFNRTSFSLTAHGKSDGPERSELV
jgi:hypothetical protein